MHILVTCPKCSKEFRFSQDKQGRSFKCKKCGEKLRVEKSPDPHADDFGFADVDLSEYPEEALPPPERKSKKKKGRSKSKEAPRTTSDMIVRGIGVALIIGAIISFAVVYTSNQNLSSDDFAVAISTYGFAPSVFITVLGVAMSVYGEEPDPMVRAQVRMTGIKAIFFGIFLIAIGAGILYLFMTSGEKPKPGRFTVPGGGLMIFGLFSIVLGLLSLITGRNFKTIGNR